MQDLDRRLERLERANRRQRLAIAALTLTIAGGALMAFSTQPSRDLKVRSLEIVDADNNARIRMDVGLQGGLINLRSAAGTDAVRIEADDKGAGRLRITDAAGSTAVRIGADPRKPAGLVEVHASNQKALTLSGQDTGGRLELFHEGSPRAQLTAQSETGQLSVFSNRKHGVVIDAPQQRGRVRLAGETGADQILLAAQKMGGRVSVRNFEGNTTVGLVAGERGGEFSVFSNAGTPVIRAFNEDGSGGSLFLANWEGAPLFVARADTTVARLSLAGDNLAPHAVLSSGPFGGALTIYDEAGNSRIGLHNSLVTGPTIDIKSEDGRRGLDFKVEDTGGAFNLYHLPEGDAQPVIAVQSRASKNGGMFFTANAAGNTTFGAYPLSSGAGRIDVRGSEGTRQFSVYATADGGRFELANAEEQNKILMDAQGSGLLRLNGESKTVLLAGANDLGHGFLTLRTASANNAFRATSREDGAQLELFFLDEKPMARILSDTVGGKFELWNHSGATIINAMCHQQGGAIQIADEFGNIRAESAVVESGARLLLFDQEGFLSARVFNEDSTGGRLDLYEAIQSGEAPARSLFATDP